MCADLYSFADCRLSYSANGANEMEPPAGAAPASSVYETDALLVELQRLEKIGAGERLRSVVSALAAPCSAIEPHLRPKLADEAGIAPATVLKPQPISSRCPRLCRTSSKLAESRGHAPQAIEGSICLARSPDSLVRLTLQTKWWARRELHSYGLLRRFLRPVRLLFRHMPVKIGVRGRSRFD
jgi:hypothetical protein